ncbi:ankyrin repeat-containing domain protein [Xylaria grammica]|nr:ankyrin repeat-containing domain protein [Xylaria grammica]
MSFGYSISDFLYLIQLTDRLRKHFVQAPEEFTAISNADHRGNPGLIHTLCSKVSHSATTGIRKLQDDVDNTQTEIKALSCSVDGVRSGVNGVQAGVGTTQADASLDEVQISIQKQNEQENIRQHRDEEEAILHWLSQIDFADQQTDLLRRREPGTGEWLLASSKYRSWIKSRRRTLFCPGVPGAGKSMIASIVIDDLSKTFRHDNSVAVAYMFYNFRCMHEQQPEDLLASLVKQILHDRPVPAEVKDLFTVHKPRRTRPSLTEISSVLSSICALFTNVFIVVDALDECQREQREKFLSEIFNLQKTKPLNLFATSRMIPEIEGLFDDSEQLEVRATIDDVHKYLDTRTSRLPTFIRGIRDEIKTEICKAVDGIFLLAQLYVNSLEGKRSIKAVRGALKDLRTGCSAYDTVYSSALQRIEDQVKDARELAKQVISWITWSRRPISMTELQHALGIELGSSVLDEDNLPDVDYMVSVCAGLVTVDHESRVIRLVHYTAQEYLERSWKHQAARFEADMSATCITLLSFSYFESGICTTDRGFEERLQAYPFYDYSARNWGNHARAGGVLDDVAFCFLRDKAKVEAAGQALAVSCEVRSQDVRGTTTGIHLAAHFGLTEAVRVLLEDGWPPDATDGYSRTPLSWATREGHEDVAKLLLESGRGESPLACAVSRRNEGLVRLLLKGGANPNFRYGDGRTGLSHAAGEGHNSIVGLLLGADKIDPNLKNLDGQGPLSCAAEAGHSSVVALLLDHPGVAPNAEDADGWTPLMAAADEGHEAAVAVLLARDGVDVNRKNTWNQTPLLRAARNGHANVVKMLLGKEEIEVDSADTSGWTPLIQAARHGHSSTIGELLKTSGVNILHADTAGRTALSWAAGQGYEALVECLLWQPAAGLLLLEAGAALDACHGLNGWTALQLATLQAHREVELLLQSRGALSEGTDFFGLELLFRSGSVPIGRAIDGVVEAVL